MRYNLIKESFKIFSKKQKLQFIILIFLLSVSSLFEMLGIFLILPVTAILFDIQESVRYENFFYFFTIIQNYFGVNYKLITVFILIIVFTIKFVFLFVTNFYKVRFLNFVNENLDNKILLNKLMSEFKEINLFKTKNFVIPIIKETGLHTQHVLQSFLIIIADLPIIFFFIIVLYMENSSVFFIIIISFSLISVLYFFFIKKKLVTFGSTRYEIERTRLDFLTKVFNSIRDIKLYDKQIFFYKNYNKISQKYFKALTSILTVSFLPRIFLEYFFIILVLTLIIFILNTSDNFVNSIPFFAFLVVSISRIAPLLNRLITALQQIKLFKQSSEYVISTLKKKISLERNTSTKTLKFKKSINLRNFTFKHSKKNKNIFKNLNMKISKNKITGIVGESGSGKSTLINIISGLIPHKSKCLYFDNILINKNNINLIIKKFSIISQNSNLIHGSIKNNIAFGEDPNKINFKKIVKVCREAGIHKFISNLPKKYNTLLSEKISNISGGQKQRIEIARALYFDREVLVLDESTSALDHFNAEIIIKTLKKLSSNKTIIFITHDKKNLNFCDDVYEISNLKAKLLK